LEPRDAQYETTRSGGGTVALRPPVSAGAAIVFQRALVLGGCCLPTRTAHGVSAALVHARGREARAPSAVPARGRRRLGQPVLHGLRRRLAVEHRKVAAEAARLGEEARRGRDAREAAAKGAEGVPLVEDADGAAEDRDAHERHVAARDGRRVLLVAVLDVAPQLGHLGGGLAPRGRARPEGRDDRRGPQVARRRRGRVDGARLDLGGVGRLLERDGGAQRGGGALGAAHVPVADGAVDAEHAGREADLPTRSVTQQDVQVGEAVLKWRAPR